MGPGMKANKLMSKVDSPMEKDLSSGSTHLKKKTVVIKGAISSLSTRLPKTNDDTTDAAH